MAGVDDDVLGREVAIKATADATGINLSAKSRLVAAIDRLAGSLFDWPAAAMEGRAAKRRLKDKIERDILEAQGQIIARRLEASNVEEEILLEVEKEDTRRQINKLSVAFEAVEALKALPSPEQDTFTQRLGDESERPSVDEDWMNSFARFAEDASSEELQRLWGRVLAGEVRQPGKFSRRALRFVAELDQRIAADCEAAARISLGENIYLSEHWNTSDGLNLMLRVQELGLVSGAGGMLQQNLVLDANGLVAFTGSKRALLLHGTPGLKKSLPIIQVTRLGQEVFSLLTPPDEDALLVEVATDMDKTELTTIQIGNFSRVGPTGIQITDAHVLWNAG